MKPPCLFGAVPTEPRPLAFGGSENLRTRWSRWLSLSTGEFARADPNEGRTWRFLAAAGIFDDEPVAGGWRMSRTREGTRLPLALVTCGAVPAVGASWFDAATTLLADAVEGLAPVPLVRRRMARLPGFTPAPPPGLAALFWIDDWEVHELHFATIQDLAAEGFARMLAPRLVPEEV